MTPPQDHAQRQRFVEELDRNFSVVASAGSGKTRGITDRIVAVARHEHAVEWLPSLVVVTYTNRAAAEMQQRARQSILSAGVSLRVLTAFNRAFFGTIHSFCLKLLRQHGHHLGLPARLELLNEADDEDLWREFVQGLTSIGVEIGEESRRTLLRLAAAQKLLELGRREMTAETQAPAAFPEFDLQPIYDFTPRDKRSRGTCERSQAALRHWQEAWNSGGFAGNLPTCECKPLRETWLATLDPILQWRQQAAQFVAAHIAQAYRAFRLQRGFMTYGDQVDLAGALLKHPEAAQRIRGKQYRVILDEAQDTDPAQFEVLLECARPASATGTWPEEPSAPPQPGHFCMVGDFQQSIYGERADLARYQLIHDALLESGAGEALTFSVTFRLDRAGTAFVNAVFPAVLHGAEGQVDFVELRARSEACPGQIVRLPLPAGPEESAQKGYWKMAWEARQLAQWLRTAGLESLRASAWREVAILCPRTRWLAPLRSALRAAGLGAQIQSERAIKGDSPAYAWFTALIISLTDPGNSYEIVGVLREVFGLSDHDLAHYAEGYGDRFHLERAHRAGGPVAAALTLLRTLREEMQDRPLFAALEHAVRTTHLRDRLLALPVDQFDHLESELEELLTLGATAEATGATLASFAADLRKGFYASRDVRGLASDAIQIISAHKSKGSEWDAVIVPYFAQAVATRSTPFPRLIRDPRAPSTFAALDGNDLDDELKSALDQKDEQELDRLLYVALTRARHTLVIADDRALFTGKKGLSAKSQAHRLRFAGGALNSGAFEALPTELTACAETTAAFSEKAERSSREKVDPLADPRSGFRAVARERARRFLKRNPSALAEAAQLGADPEGYAENLRPSSSPSNAGKLYGTWWHSFVEELAWKKGMAAWDTSFAGHVDQSPDPARSRHEWSLLRQHLLANSALAREVTAADAVIHAEMPFLWAMNPQECLDGIIDLAIFHPSEGRWLILDWKTNRVPADGLAELRRHYLPQLSAYWKAAREMLCAPVAAGLYSTHAGQWLPYQDAELDEAWENLHRDPALLTTVLDED